jgi:hypothetical protein
MPPVSNSNQVWITISDAGSATTVRTRLAQVADRDPTAGALVEETGDKELREIVTSIAAQVAST